MLLHIFVQLLLSSPQTVVHTMLPLKNLWYIYLVEYKNKRRCINISFQIHYSTSGVRTLRASTLILPQTASFTSIAVTPYPSSLTLFTIVSSLEESITCTSKLDLINLLDILPPIYVPTEKPSA